MEITSPVFGSLTTSWAGWHPGHNANTEHRTHIKRFLPSMSRWSLTSRLRTQDPQKKIFLPVNRWILNSRLSPARIKYAGSLFTLRSRQPCNKHSCHPGLGQGIVWVTKFLRNKGIGQLSTGTADPARRPHPGCGKTPRGSVIFQLYFEKESLQPTQGKQSQHSVLGEKGFPGGSVVKNPSTCQCRSHRSHRFDPWVGKILWRKRWPHTPVFLPRK